MKKFIKVMFGTKGADYEYKIDELNIANNWNPESTSGRDFGGFNFSTEDKILRWLHRGNILYDIIVPDDAKVIDVVESATPHGVFRSDKIIPTNPREVTDEMAMYFYEKSTIPEIAYCKSLAVCAVMGYNKTAHKIFEDKVNKDNIKLYLEEWNDFFDKKERKDKNDTVISIDKLLNDLNNL